MEKCRKKFKIRVFKQIFFTHILKYFFYFPGLKYAMMSMKVLIATILRKYILIKDKVTPIANIKLKVDVMLKPVETITLRIKNRTFK